MATTSNTPSYTADHFWAQRQAENEQMRQQARQMRAMKPKPNPKPKGRPDININPHHSGGAYF